MKKLTALLLALVMALGLAGCGKDSYEAAIDAVGGPDGPAVTFYAVIGDEEAPEDTAMPEETPTSDESAEEDPPAIDEEGWYYSAGDVSLYLHTYGYLPGNFITKSEARDLGWEGGSVEEYAPGRAIGGDVFQNREGLLPEADGRVYYECDIDTDGYHSRGSRRICFSNDGLIYYTSDHYESFILLYGEE